MRQESRSAASDSHDLDLIALRLTRGARKLRRFVENGDFGVAVWKADVQVDDGDLGIVAVSFGSDYDELHVDPSVGGDALVLLEEAARSIEATVGALRRVQGRGPSQLST